MNGQGAVMTGSGSAAVPPQKMDENAGAESSEEWVESRFGRVKIFRQNPVIFPSGLLGIPDKFEYCLTSFPSEKLNARFKLLQSLEDDKLSFITLPVDIDNNILDRADIEQGCRDLDLSIDNLAMLLIVSVHRETTPAKISVNARAPLMMDAPKRTASQYVFHNAKYEIRHMISGG